MSKVVSDAHVDGFYYRPRTDLETLAEYSKGLIAFTGCMQGWIPQLLIRGEEEEAEKAMGQMVEIFGKENYFVELTTMGSRNKSSSFPSF